MQVQRINTQNNIEFKSKTKTKIFSAFRPEEATRDVPTDEILTPEMKRRIKKFTHQNAINQINATRSAKDIFVK